MSKMAQIDQEVLAKIFFPGQQPSAVSGLFSFGKKPVRPGFQSLSFGYVNNPDGSIRWLYPLGIRQPLFLRLYNGSGWRGSLFSLAFRAAFLLRNERLVRSGTVHVFHKNQPLLGGLFDLCPMGKMAIFTGTVGENRKAVIALDDPDGNAWFYKQPLTPEAANLVKNEQRVLAELAQLGLQKMQVPTVKPYASGLMVSSVKPTAASNSFDLQPAHFEAVVELSELTVQQNQLGSLPFWEEINTNLEALQQQPILNDLSQNTVSRIIDQLLVLHQSFDPEMTVPTSLTHGDFTPWNMYLGGGRLHVYDWELSERLPLLNDVFHFVFQSGVLIERFPYSEIEPIIFSIKKDERIQVFLKERNNDFELLYALYLLRNISYYLLKYMRQKSLHQQAHWLLSAWDLALKNAIDFFLQSTAAYSQSFAKRAVA